MSSASASKAKSDRNYAIGIARSMQTGWYREVRVKRLDSHAIKALLVGHALLVKMRGEIENQIRGLVKNLGLVIGRAKRNTFTTRVQERIEDKPALQAVAEPNSRDAVEQQIAEWHTIRTAPW